MVCKPKALTKFCWHRSSITEVFDNLDPIR